MRASTLCIVALACFITQFTSALPLNLKRGTDAGAGAASNGPDAVTETFVVTKAPNSGAVAGVDTGASPTSSGAAVVADGGENGHEFGETVATGKDLGLVSGFVAAGAAGAVGQDNSVAGATGTSTAVEVKDLASVSASKAGGASASDIANGSGGTADAVAVGLNGVGTVTATDTNTLEFSPENKGLIKPDGGIAADIAPANK